MKFDIQLMQDLSIENISKNFDLDHLQNEAEIITISSISAANLATSMILLTKQYDRYIQTIKEDHCKSANDYLKKAQNVVKELEKRFEDIRSILEKKIFDWMELENQLPFGQIEKISVLQGTLSVKEIFTFEIEDSSLIPFQYLSPNVKEITKSINAGIRNIPGIRIFRDKSIQTRLKSFN